MRSEIKAGMPPLGSGDFSALDGSLKFDKPAGGPPPEFRVKMADIAWVKRKYLDLPYETVSPAQRLDLYLPDEGDGPFPLVVHLHGGGFGMSTNGTTTWTLICRD